jgi:prepilin-type N-terminal cleavage/methylation domain-containing protein
MLQNFGKEGTTVKKHNEGFSLVEVLLAMVLLAAIVIPTCTSLVLSFRVNAKAEALTQAQLAVSSAVETLMAEGIDGERAAYVIENFNCIYDSIPSNDKEEGAATITETEPGETPFVEDVFSGVQIKILDSQLQNGTYHIEVSDNAGLVTVTTYIRIKGGSQ